MLTFWFCSNECSSVLRIDVPDSVPLYEAQSTLGSPRNAEESLCSFLKLLGKFRNPAALYQEVQIKAWIVEVSLIQNNLNCLLHYAFQLLNFRNGKVQELAVKFLLNYGVDYMQPYRDYLLRLLEEKEMWNTLVEIEFGAANPVIAEEHRSRVVPIIIR